MLSRTLFALGVVLFGAMPAQAETTFDAIPQPPARFSTTTPRQTPHKVTYSSTVRHSTAMARARAANARQAAQPVRHRQEPAVQYGPYAQIGGEASSAASASSCKTCRRHAHRKPHGQRSCDRCQQPTACDATCKTCDASPPACDSPEPECDAPVASCQPGGCSCDAPCQCHQQGGCQCQAASHAHHTTCENAICLGKGGQHCHQCAAGGQCPHCQTSRHPLCGTLFHSTCDMPQHYPYCSRPMSYYYFRPYQIDHVAIHQNFVQSYGGNPKHPYANTIFDRIYNEAGAAEEMVMPMQEEILMPMPVEQP